MSNRPSAMLVTTAFSTLLVGLVVIGEEPPKIAEIKPGEVRELEIASGVKMKFCWIPPGKAQLGSPQVEREYFTKHFLDGNPLSVMDGESEIKRGQYVSK